MIQAIPLFESFAQLITDELIQNLEQHLQKI